MAMRDNYNYITTRKATKGVTSNTSDPSGYPLHVSLSQKPTKHDFNNINLVYSSKIRNIKYFYVLMS